MTDNNAVNKTLTDLGGKFKVKNGKRSDENSEKRPLLKEDVSIQFSPEDIEVIASYDKIDPEEVVYEILNAKKKPSKHSHHESKVVSNTGTVLNILKANVGTGLLAMPHAISHFGMMLGVIFIFLLGLLYTYCIHLLFEISMGIAKCVLKDREDNMWLEVSSSPDFRKKYEEYIRRKNLDIELQEKDQADTWIANFVEDIEMGEASSAAAPLSCNSPSVKKTDTKKGTIHMEKKQVHEEDQNPKSKKAGVSQEVKADIVIELGKETRKRPKSKKTDLPQKVKADIEQEKGGKKMASKEANSSQKVNTDVTQEVKEEVIDKESKQANGTQKINTDVENFQESEKGEKTNSKESCSKLNGNTSLEKEQEGSKTTTTRNLESAKGDSIEVIDVDAEKEKLNVEEIKNPFEGLFVNDPEKIDKVMRSLDYPKLIQLAFRFRFPSSRFMTIVSFFYTFYAKLVLLLTHIGCCSVCFLFVVESLCQMTVTSPYITHENSFTILIYGLPVMMCVSFIPHGYELTGVTAVAFFLQCGGIGIMLVYFFSEDHSEDIHWYTAPAETWYRFFCVIFYAFEGAGTTLHLASHIEDSKAIRGKTGVLNKSFVFFILPLFTVFGAFGYWKFGNEVEPSVTFNMPDKGLNLTAQILTAMGILLTYPFHFQFVHTTLKSFFIRDKFSNNCKQALDLIIRGCFVLVAYAIPATFPHLEFLLTILGADASCYLVLVVPAMMSIVTIGVLPGVRFSVWRVAIHVMILVLGYAGMLVGTAMVIYDYPHFSNTTTD